MHMYVDAHVHCSDLLDIEQYVESGDFLLTCVSDDIQGIYEVLRLRQRYGSTIIPCVGIHPWSVHEYRLRDIQDFLHGIVSNENITCIGEVGLDKRFKPETYDIQVEFFDFFVKLAREYDLALNLHTAGTWREVFDLLVRNDINRAYFHWYTGPLELLESIRIVGYYIGINPAWKIQEKHRVIIENADPSTMITESDAPYKYRGLELQPSMVKDTLEYIASVKKMDFSEIASTVRLNFIKLFIQ